MKKTAGDTRPESVSRRRPLIRKAACWAMFAGGLAFAQVVPAGEHELNYRLVTRGIDVKVEKVAEVEGQMVSTGRYGGTAVFEDGRIANKEFVFAFDFRKGAGPFFGYSTYTFTDGSMLVMRFEGTLESGKPMRGEYTVLSGSGIYEGATGSGYFEKDSEPWEKANLFNGKLSISTP